MRDNNPNLNRSTTEENLDDDITSFFNFGKSTSMNNGNSVNNKPVESKVSQKRDVEVQSFTEEKRKIEETPIKSHNVQTITDKKVDSPVISRTIQNLDKAINEFDQEDGGMEYIGKIPNVPTRKFYPERKFDKYAQKDCRLEENDLELLRAWCNQIGYRRKRSKINGSIGRITDNTIIRILLSEFASKLSNDIESERCKSILTEDDLRTYISELINTKTN